MSEHNFTLIYTGKIDEGKNLEDVHEKLAEVFKTDIERISRMFSTKRSIIKKNADRATCQKMLQLIQNAGAICVIESDDAPVEETAAPRPKPEPTLPPASEPKRAPAPQANPYAAPQSELKTRTGQDALGFTDPQKRPAGNGASWVMAGIALFLKRPFKWIGIFFVYMLVSILVQIVPIIGPLIQSLLNPVYGGGLMIGAKELEETDELPLECLFRGFKSGFGQLVLLGLIFLCALVVCVIISVVIGFAAMGIDFSNLQNQMTHGTPPIIPFLIMFLLIIALTMPLIMVFWFAPALIAINEKPVFDAMGLSFKACMRNVLPFLVYSLVVLAVLIGVFMAVGLIAAIFGGTSGSGVGMIIPAILFIFLGLSIMPVVLLTIYTSYKDIFYKE